MRRNFGYFCAAAAADAEATLATLRRCLGTHTARRVPKGQARILQTRRMVTSKVVKVGTFGNKSTFRRSHVSNVAHTSGISFQTDLNRIRRNDFSYLPIPSNGGQ